MQKDFLNDEEIVEGVVVGRDNNGTYEVPSDESNVDNVATQEEFDNSVDASDTQPLVEETEATEQYNEPMVQEQPQTQPQPQMFTQEQVNELVGRTRVETRDKTLRQLMEKYGVENDNELDGIFGKGQSFDVLNGQYTDLNGRYESVMAENALLRSGIDQSRYEDAMLILRGKGLPITLENINNELITHPEWKGSTTAPIQAAPMQPITESQLEQIVNTPTENTIPEASTTIKRMGTNIPGNVETDTDKDMILRKFFGLK